MQSAAFHDTPNAEVEGTEIVMYVLAPMQLPESTEGITYPYCEDPPEALKSKVEG
jgi:hypothetical protein